MRTVVVTGPIGGGKSSLTRLLASAGAAVVKGDEVGHAVLRTPEVRRRLRRAFGPAVFAGSEVDRGALGALVFADAAALARLNAITHGPLAAEAGRRLAALAAAGAHDLAVLEAAVYFLLPQRPAADLVVTVTAPPAVRLQRLVARDGLTPQDAARRIAAQADMAAAWAGADLTIDNHDGRQVLVEACVEIGRRLGCRLSPAADGA